MVTKIISGGQTGADQAGLAVAKRLGIPAGGFLPKGFLTEAGPRHDLAAEYGLVKTEQHLPGEKNVTHLRLDGPALELVPAQAQPGTKAQGNSVLPAAGKAVLTGTGIPKSGNPPGAGDPSSSGSGEPTPPASGDPVIPGIGNPSR